MLKKFTSISKVELWDKLPSRALFNKEAILIFDRRLPNLSKEFLHWTKGFDKRIGIASGEKSKSVENFAKLAKKILDLAQNCSRHQIQLVSVGGGSVGDQVGFLASTLKRGVPLIHIASTWLSSLDSAHGGKTALNVAGFKNQIGTFHKAESVFLVKSLLWNQPSSRAFEALSELIKVSLIRGGATYSSLKKDLDAIRFAPRRIGNGRSEIKLQDEALRRTLWNNLPAAIRAKSMVVAQDPIEKRGKRRVLNLGHTLGHVFEAHWNWPHGVAVAEGLKFAVRWSLRRKILKEKEGRLGILDYLQILPQGKRPRQNYFLTEAKLKKLILQDKKAIGRSKIAFIFLKEPGKPKILNVGVSEIIEEARLQGFIR